MSDKKTIIPEEVKEELAKVNTQLDEAIKKAERLEVFAQKLHSLFDVPGRGHVRLQYKAAKYILTAGVWFWAIESAYFIAWYGWHIRATTEAEKICNKISTTMLVGAVLLYLLIAIQIIDRLFKK